MWPTGMVANARGFGKMLPAWSAFVQGPARSGLTLRSQPLGHTRWSRRAASSRCRQVCPILLVVLASSCAPESVSCPASPNRQPIVVEVRDATTGEAAAVGTTGSIRDGEYVSALILPHPDELLTLYSQGLHGTYDVIVQRPGYRDWTRNGVYVRGGDECGGNVSTVTLRANLERAP